MNKGVLDYPRSSRRSDHCSPCVRTTVHYLSCGDFVKAEMLDMQITDSAGVSDWLPVPYLVGRYAGIPGGILISFTGYLCSPLHRSKFSQGNKEEAELVLHGTLKAWIGLVVAGFRHLLGWNLDVFVVHS